MTTNGRGRVLLARLLKEHAEEYVSPSYKHRTPEEKAAHAAIAEARALLAAADRMAELEARIATLESEAEEARINSLDDNDY